MNIVVLDGYTLNPGDITWDGISALGYLTVYDRTAEKDVIQRCKNAEIVFTNKTPLTESKVVSIDYFLYLTAKISSVKYLQPK